MRSLERHSVAQVGIGLAAVTLPEALPGVDATPTATPGRRPKARPVTRLFEALLQTIFHWLCFRDATRPLNYEEQSFDAGFASTQRFFERFDEQVSFADKRVLDVGCGYGTTCIYMALHGAREVLGIDISERAIQFAQEKLRSSYGELESKVAFQVMLELERLGDRQFDVILSKDSFEHIADPASYFETLAHHLADGGILAIGFGPFWRSPRGAHLDFMTRVPWVHLLFPERVILRERRRFRPDEQASRFEEIVGGLNRMTLARFLQIASSQQVRAVFMQVNVSNSPIRPLFNLLRRLPFCRELFTFNVYSVWQKPNQGASPTLNNF